MCFYYATIGVLRCVGVGLGLCFGLWAWATVNFWGLGRGLGLSLWFGGEAWGCFCGWGRGQRVMLGLGARAEVKVRVRG